MKHLSLATLKRVACIVCALVLVCATQASAAKRNTKSCPQAKVSTPQNYCDGLTSQFGSPYRAPNTPKSCSPVAQPTRSPRKTTGGYYSSESPNVQVSGINSDEKNLIAYVNEDRAAYGLPAYAVDPTLCAAARRKAQDMKDNRYFAHTSPTLGGMAQQLRSEGFSSYRGVGENIAKHATVAKSEAAFMSSSGHRANILSKSFTKIGVGVVQENGYVIVVQVFAN